MSSVSSMRAWHSLLYVLARGFRGMRQSIHVQVLAVGTIAVCLVMLGTVSLVWKNAHAATLAWGLDAPITAYLNDDAADSAIAELEGRLLRLPEVERLERVAPEQALRRMTEGFGGEPELFAAVDARWMPTSIDVHLRDGTAPTLARAIADRVAKYEVVDEVAVLGPWAAQASLFVDTLRNLVFGIGVLVCLACTTIVWSTIRLGVFARRDEVRIYQLVGGTHRFVAGPFLVEGAVQGCVGAGLALMLMHVAFDTLAPHLRQGLELVFAAGALSFFSALEMALGVALGGSLGLLGAWAAVRRYAES